MTFKVLANDLQKVLFRSAICSATTPGEQNLQVDPLGGEVPSIMKLSHDPAPQMPFDPGGQAPDSPPPDENGTKMSQLPTFHPFDLVGHTFLLDPQEDGQRFRTRIVEALEDHNAKLHQKPERFKFHCSINNDQYEDILSYNEILNYIEQQDDDGMKVWQFHRIMAHEGPLRPTDPTYKGSMTSITRE